MSNATAEKKLADIKPEVVELSNRLSKHIAVAKDGTTTVGENLFESHLPESLTPEVVAEVRNYTSNFIAAGQHSFGMAAVGALNDNKKLNEVSTTIGLGGKDTLELSVARSKTYVDRMGENKDNPREIVKYGVCVATVTQAGHSNSTGQLGLVRKHIGQHAAELLGK